MFWYFSLSFNFEHQFVQFQFDLITHFSFWFEWQLWLVWDCERLACFIWWDMLYFSLFFHLRNSANYWLIFPRCQILYWSKLWYPIKIDLSNILIKKWCHHNTFTLIKFFCITFIFFFFSNSHRYFLIIYSLFFLFLQTFFVYVFCYVG